MTKFSCLSLLSLFVASCLVSPSSCDPQTELLINKICRQTSDFAFCNDILYRNLVSPTTDLLGLTKLTINISLSYANYIETSIQKLEAAVERNPQVKQVYAGCERNYQEVVGFIGSAKYDVDRADYRSMVGQLQLCNKPITFCQNAIGDVVLELREKFRKMTVLLSMGLYEGGQL